jgi:hypothetical protein
MSEHKGSKVSHWNYDWGRLHHTLHCPQVLNVTIIETCKRGNSLVPRISRKLCWSNRYGYLCPEHDTPSVLVQYGGHTRNTRKKQPNVAQMHKCQAKYDVDKNSCFFCHMLAIERVLPLSALRTRTTSAWLASRSHPVAVRISCNSHKLVSVDVTEYSSIPPAVYH